MVVHVHTILQDNLPDHIIQYTEANDLPSEKKSSQTSKSFPELAMPLESDGNFIIVSGIIPWYDNLNNKINKVNNHLALMHKQKYSFPFHNLDSKT